MVRFLILLRLALALVQGDDLVDLGTDAEHRVQARHGLLEDHRDIVAAQAILSAGVLAMS